MTRRTINLNGCPWIGWNKLLGLCNKSKTDRQRNSFIAIFETGCRVSEAILLSPSMFEIKDFGLVATRVPYIKRGSRKSGNVRVEPRDFLIPMDPLTKDLADFIESRKGKSYLFPHPKPFTSEPDEERHTSRVTMYRGIRSVDTISSFSASSKSKPISNRKETRPLPFKGLVQLEKLGHKFRIHKGHTQRPS